MLSPFSRILAATTLLALSAPVFSEQVVLYGREEFRGRNVTITRPTPDLELMGFENRAASIYVMSGTWEFCTEPQFRGECRIYAPGEYRDLGDQTKRISSARLVNETPRNEWRNSGGARAELFDRENFSGPLGSLREATPNFGPLGYNDKVASIIIRRGTWEFCSDNRFSGDCRIFGPGEYPRLGRGEDDRFSSARPIQDQVPGSGNPPPASNRARIQLFEYPNFAGRSITLDRQAPNFDPLGFNDKAESVIVESGVWTLCSDNNRSGQCRELRSGQYPVLPYELNSRVSSAYPNSGPGNVTPPPVSNRVRIQLFEQANFGGRSITLDREASNFQPLGFNDKAESAIVEGGFWTLCSDANRGGQCRELRTGQYPVLPTELNSRVSSAYPR